MRASTVLKVCELRLQQDQDDDDFVLAHAHALLKWRRRHHRWWVHPINQVRKQHGAYRHLYIELLLFDGERFQQYFRLTREQFSPVLHLIALRFTNHWTKRGPNTPRQRLAVCMR